MINAVSRLSSAACRAALRSRNLSAVRPASHPAFWTSQQLYKHAAARAFGTQSCTGAVNLCDLVGREMPSFKTAAVVDGAVKDFDAAEHFRGSYGLIIFYPLDFTFVCPTELLSFSERLSEFEERGVKVIGVSIDSPFSHLAWSQMDLKSGGLKGLKFPLVSDMSRSIVTSFGVLRPEGFAQRSSVLVDKSGKVRHVAVFDLGIGRSVDETLRVFDAIKLSDETGQVCPANWKKGGAAIAPTAASTGEYLDKTFVKA
ncbi:2-cys peroxiredoxin [Babesia caballi]|uniref:2-cys peroxiredoxin n=1 Tax=Babesia caballi TaxID=5871 RepID=A0AAV4M0S9_BABCB|nr:2-cys peroxiredoxin [Babesia caballi]